ncbi:hypothetical protein HK102_008056 [Quaeritorhiza haematococci]|nr:hypothetical protein HK102_008056 [Quaeritorhiza haematococci]
MTSAARPTWLPAMGGHSLRDTNRAPLNQYSSRDLAAHTKLKLRQPGQNAPEDIEEADLRARLEQAEQEHRAKSKKSIRDESEEDLALTKRPRIEDTEPKSLDADDTDDDDDDEGSNAGRDSGSDSDDSDDDDDEDDTAELLKELEKIRKERAEEKERAERERMEEEMRQKEEEALTGNPLLAGASSSQPKDFSVKRRWDDDVIFKNQAKGQDGKVKPRFINDLLRYGMFSIENEK